METTPPEPTTQSWSGTSTFTRTGDATQFAIEIGLLSSPGEAQALDGSGTALDSVCAPNSERDLAAPFSITVSNGNEGFSQKPTIAFWGTDVTRPSYASEGAILDAAINYSSGPECEGIGRWSAFGRGGESLDCASVSDLAPGEGVVCSGFLIVKDGRSPASPEGDFAALTNRYLVLSEVPSTERGPRESSGLSGNFVDLQGLPQAEVGASGGGRSGIPLTSLISASQP